MLNKISLKRRLWLSLVLLWTVVIFCTAIGVKGLLDTQRSLQLIHEDRMGTISLLQEITANFDDTRSNVFSAFQHDPNHDLHLLHNHGVRQHTDTIRENRKKNIGFRERLKNRQVNEVEAGLRDDVFTNLNAWREQLDVVVQGIDRSEYSNRLMMTFLTAMQNEGVEVQDSIKALSNYQIEQADVASLFAKRQIKTSLLFFTILYALLALPASLFMVLSLRRLNYGLREVENALDSITRGDLTYPVPLSGNDEMTRAKRKVIAMQQSLTKLITGIREGADKIEADISNLSTFSRELVDRNITQSASLEQTSAATEELNGTVEHNAENARQAEETSQEANHAAIRGGDAVKGVVAIMGEINQSSEHISNIVSIIDSIAFQTNILALNAAVEAARAGEQGRGFAVVASEVRALAQRSASAAGDIKKLVDESIQVVNSGSQQVNSTGDMMRDIVESNAKLTTLIGEISSASAEQVIGLGQINQAMMQMDRSNHENNELASNTDEITKNLYEQSQHLMELVATFRLPNDYGH